MTDPNFIDVDASLPGGDADPDVFVIHPLTALPSLTRDAIVVDGDSQRAATGDTNPFGPEIVLDGGQVVGGGSGLRIYSDYVTVRSLNIQRFPGNGVWIIGGSFNEITGDYIGVNATGDAAQTADGAATGVANSGVVISGGGQGNRIGGDSPAQRNVISSNGYYGVVISQAGGGNVVSGNYIGTTADGMSALGNGSAGVFINNSANNTVGGAEPGARNVISGNATGVSIVGPLASGNHVAGNYIGVAADGATPLGNADGVVVLGDYDPVRSAPAM